MFYSPTPGQELSTSQPFRLEFSSDYYYKDHTKNVTVLISSGNYPYTFGIELGTFTPMDSIRNYTAEVTPKFAYYWDKKSNFTISVLERHTTDYGSMDAFSIFSQPVTFAD
uniref:Uncharacterized protein n=1 Tax=Moniliophthora roreri TaxID=221103 RepID=A0A0W0FSU0_MONRR